MVQTFPVSVDDTRNIPALTGPAPVQVMMPPNKSVEKKLDLKEPQDLSHDHGNPWWLYLVGLYEIAMLVYKAVTTAFFFSVGMDSITTVTGRSTDKVETRVVKIALIISAVILVVTLLFMLVMTSLMAVALVTKNIKSRKTNLKRWTYGSYVLIALNCIALAATLKTVLIDWNDHKEFIDDNAEVIVGMVLTLADLLIRILAALGTGKIVKELTVVILNSGA